MKALEDVVDEDSKEADEPEAKIVTDDQKALMSNSEKAQKISETQFI